METARKAIIGRVVSEYELMLDKRANEKETEGKAECLCGTCSSDGSECDEMSLD